MNYKKRDDNCATLIMNNNECTFAIRYERYR